MTASNFNASLALTLAYEGGWSDNPRDPGGATMCGVTQAVYDDDRESRNLPRQSVRLSTEAERAAIYRARYWTKAGCNLLPTGVDYAVFDFAVNSGVGRAVRTLQRIVGVEQDGDIGRYTLAAVASFAAQHGATAITDALCHERMAFLLTLSTFETFGKGWTRRVMGQQEGTQPDDTGVIDRAFDMALGTVVARPMHPQATPKTYMGAS